MGTRRSSDGSEGSEAKEGGIDRGMLACLDQNKIIDHINEQQYCKNFIGECNDRPCDVRGLVFKF